MNLKARFKPRAEAGLLSRLVQEAWQDYQNRIASPERQAEVAEVIARHFETVIPAADAVIDELTRYLRAKGIAWTPSDNLADKLTNKAERCYAKNSRFRKRLRSQADQGRAGRDWLYAFMRHWLSAEFAHGSEIHRNLPEGFCVGRSAKMVSQ